MLRELKKKKREGGRETQREGESLSVCLCGCVAVWLCVCLCPSLLSLTQGIKYIGGRLCGLLCGRVRVGSGGDHRRYDPGLHSGQGAWHGKVRDDLDIVLISQSVSQRGVSQSVKQ